MKKVLKNPAASIHQRLLNIAQQRGQPFNQLLQYFALERFLYRLSKSQHASKFILKGGVLFSVWQGDFARTTVDIDLMGIGSPAIEPLRQIISEVCQVDGEEDGLQFDANTLEAAPIREEQHYKGLRFTFKVYLGNARLPMQVDIGFGDALVPSPQRVTVPSLLTLPTAQLSAYSRESMIAEKLHAMVELDLDNSRMKDFYDIWTLSQQFDFEGNTLTQAIAATFAKQHRPIPTEPPIALTAVFAEHPFKAAQWKAFLRRTRLDVGEHTLATIIPMLDGFLSPLLKAVANHQPFTAFWSAGGPWK